MKACLPVKIESHRFVPRDFIGVSIQRRCRTDQNLVLKKEALSFFFPLLAYYFSGFEIDELALVGAAIYFASPSINHIHCADQNPAIDQLRLLSSGHSEE